MSSSVFYKFKNSKEPERIVFDGTGISVFELKREIITASGLGDGSDFDLHLYPEDQPTTEYDDDTTIISRSSTVIAVRRPAARGHGRAARYVSGRAPVRAIKKTDSSKSTLPTTSTGALSEQDAEAAFLAESAQVWDQQKESLSHAKPVYHKKKPVNVPTHDPPPGYVCYRCQKKGHWIQACPTNDDPDFKPIARAKRTTGIPRSFLKTVEKPAEGEEDARGVMLNADGEYVQVMTDTKTWEKFQEKANASKAQAANADAANKEMEERGLICPIDKRMYVDPVKTPCCSKTYCHDCIENALADGDLVCPNCSEDGVLIDDLVADEDMLGKIRAYEAEKAKEKVDKEQQTKEDAAAVETASSNPIIETPVSVSTPGDEKAKTSDIARSGSKSPGPDGNSLPVPVSSADTKSPHSVAANPSADSTSAGGGNGSDTDTSTASKKRKEAPNEIQAPTAPKAMRLQKEQQTRQTQDPSSIEKNFIESMEALKNMPSNMPVVPPMPMSVGMPMNPMMGAMNPPNMGGMNPMQQMGMPNMNGFGNFNAGWNNGYNNGYGNQQQQQYGNMGYGANMNGYGNMGYAGQMNGGMQGNMGGYGGSGWNNQQGYGGPMDYSNQAMSQQNANFQNQQRTVFAEQPNQQDAYERRPLNPHRAQNRNRKQRAPDFHYVG
jgi:protein MPE1